MPEHEDHGQSRDDGCASELSMDVSRRKLSGCARERTHIRRRISVRAASFGLVLAEATLPWVDGISQACHEYMLSRFD